MWDAAQRSGHSRVQFHTMLCRSFPLRGAGGGGRGGGNVLSIVFGNREQRLSFGAGQNSLEGVENLVKRRW